MKRGKTYTMSDKRKLRDKAQTDWAARMAVVSMYENEGMTFTEIGKKMGYSRSNAYIKYHLAKKMLPR